MSTKDQLKFITRTIGTPSSPDRSFISGSEAQEYLNLVCEHRHHNKLDKLFPSAPAESLALLNGLLEFNPFYRLSAKDALQSPLFDNIRQRHFEKPCAIQINQKIYREDAYDYEKFEDVSFSI